MARPHRNRGRRRDAPRRDNQPRIPERVPRPLPYIKAKTVAVLGPSGAGKTAWLSRFTDALQKRHRSTILCGAISGVMIYPIDFTSNRGSFRMNVLDVPDDINRHMLDHLLYGVDALILMFDLHSADPFPRIRFKHECIKSIKFLGPIPILLCGNKADISSVSRLQRAASASRFARQEKFKWYFEISALANYQIIDPFLYAAQLAEGLTDRDFYLIEQPNLAPHEKWMHHLEEQLEVEPAIANILIGVESVDNVQYSLKYQRALLIEEVKKSVNFFGEYKCEEEEDAV